MVKRTKRKTKEQRLREATESSRNLLRKIEIRNIEIERLQTVIDNLRPRGRGAVLMKWAHKLEKNPSIEWVLIVRNGEGTNVHASNGSAAPLLKEAFSFEKLGFYELLRYEIATEVQKQLKADHHFREVDDDA